MLGEDDAAATYDPNTGYLTVTLPKEVKGQEFKDLDLLAKLLAPRPPESSSAQPLIEVLHSEDTKQDEDEELADRTRALTLEQRQILEGELIRGSSRFMIT